MTKAHRICIRCTKEESDKLKQYAKIDGKKNLSEYIIERYKCITVEQLAKQVDFVVDSITIRKLKDKIVELMQRCQ